MLDPEPRSASVTTLENTLLFRLNKEPFDEVMADRAEIVASVIHALCQRIREQGRLLLARTMFQARWVSFALISAFPLLLQIGFVILGSQAGRMLDVRQIKRLFPQIVTGFVVGFIIGGLLMPFLSICCAPSKT